MGLYRPKWKKDGQEGRSKHWWLEYRVDGRRHRVNLKVSDKRAAESAARKIITSAEQLMAGVGTFDATRATPPLELVEEYIDELKRRGRDPLHVSITHGRLKRIFANVGRLDGMNPVGVRAALRRVTASEKLTSRTQNYYRLALSAVFNWLVREGRWISNPVKAVMRANETESVRTRRSLDPDELKRLLGCPKIPVHRRTLYQLTFFTGLRRGEIGRLERRDLVLDRGILICRAAISKNKKEKIMVLPPAMVTGLAAHVATLKKPEDPDADESRSKVFPQLPQTKTFYKDLKRAQVARTTPEGWIDFHALGRTSRATLLAQAGVALTTTQKLMRHSTPALTANVYTRLGLDEERQAALKLADVAGMRVLEAAPEGPEIFGRFFGRTGVTSPDEAALTSTNEKAQSREIEPRNWALIQAFTSMDGPGLEPGTPGFSVLCSTS